MGEFFEGLSDQEKIQFLTNINKMRLNRKPHIKKYNKYRKIHGEIVDSMEEYIESGKYDVNLYTNKILDKIGLELKGKNIIMDIAKEDDKTFFLDLYCYKNHKNLPSVTEIYLEKNKFKNPEKVKVLNSMNNSVVGLFKIVDVDRENGYAYLEDVFTKKRYKTVDIALSSTFSNRINVDLYMYNRIITVDDISFTTGIHCLLSSKNSKLKKFIKKHNYKKCSDYSRTFLIYEILKEESYVKSTYNNQYGNR